MIGNFFGFLSNDIGIDLGTANTLVFVRIGALCFVNQVWSTRYKSSKKVCAVGSDAKDLGQPRNHRSSPANERRSDRGLEFPKPC